MSGGLLQPSLEPGSVRDLELSCTTTKLCTRVTPSYVSLARLIYGPWQYYDDSKLLTHVREAIEALSAIEHQVIAQLDCNHGDGHSKFTLQTANSIEVTSLREDVNSL